LKKFFYKPVGKVLSERRAMLDKQYDDAKKAEDEALANKAEWEEKMQGAEAEAESILKEATVRADRRSERIVEEAKEKADIIVRTAQAEAALERKKATEGIKREIVDVSSCLSEKILEREIKTSDHKKIIDSFIAEIGEGDE
jgi:F-type H+-transporting ATPase subunit b